MDVMSDSDVVEEDVRPIESPWAKRRSKTWTKIVPGLEDMGPITFTETGEASALIDAMFGGTMAEQSPGAREDSVRRCVVSSIANPPMSKSDFMGLPAKDRVALYTEVLIHTMKEKDGSISPDGKKALGFLTDGQDGQNLGNDPVGDTPPETPVGGSGERPNVSVTVGQKTSPKPSGTEEQ